MSTSMPRCPSAAAAARPPIPAPTTRTFSTFAIPILLGVPDSAARGASQALPQLGASIYRSGVLRLSCIVSPDGGEDLARGKPWWNPDRIRRGGAARGGHEALRHRGRRRRVSANG